MESTLQFFSIISAIALVVQVVILAALFFQLRRTMDNVNRLTEDLHARVGPLLARLQALLDDTQPKISAMISDASHVVYLARGQAQKVDRVLTDAADRLRGQIVHADRILTGTLEAVEDAGVRLRRGVWAPMHKASALMQGLKVGLDILRSRKSGVRSSEPREHQEEELFI